MKVLGIITARGGSKGVPGKNTKILGEIPLLAYSAIAAHQSNLLFKTILSSDDETIINIAKNYYLEIPYVRPQELATDTASSIDVVKHAVTFLEDRGEFYDAICLLQPTSPFRQKGFIDKSIEKFINSGADALVSVLTVPHEFNPHWVFEKDRVGNLKIATGDNEVIKRRQDLPTAYFRDGAIYITKTSVIKQGSFYGESLTYIENDPDLYVNIDTIEDWQKAQDKLPLIKHKL